MIRTGTRRSTLAPMEGSSGDSVGPGPLDAVLALAVTGLELSDLFLVNARTHHDALTVGLVLAAAVPLVGWRRWPFVLTTRPRAGNLHRSVQESAADS